MKKIKSNLAQDVSQLPDPVKFFQELMDKNGLTIRLTPIGLRQVEDGSLIIDQGKIAVNYKINEAKNGQSK